MYQDRICTSIVSLNVTKLACNFFFPFEASLAIVEIILRYLNVNLVFDYNASSDVNHRCDNEYLVVKFTNHTEHYRTN